MIIEYIQDDVIDYPSTHNKNQNRYVEYPCVYLSKKDFFCKENIENDKYFFPNRQGKNTSDIALNPHKKMLLECLTFL